MRPIDGDKLYADLREAGMVFALRMVAAAPTIAPPPNDPLTLDELREMDGEPVWVKGIVDDMEENWGIITVSERGLFARTVIRSYSKCTYGYYWLAYRRKLKEGTT